MAVLLRSQLRCPDCQELISSVNRHDFNTCGCGGLSIDGGRDYLRVSAKSHIMDAMREEGGLREIDCSISIAGEHNNASAATALVVYKALWLASERGERPAPATTVRFRTASVGNGRQLPLAQVRAYLKLFCEDGGPVERSSRGFLPLVELHERPDAP
jgi:hypothetical protein